MRQGFGFSIIVMFSISCFADTLVVDLNGTGDYLTIQSAIDAAQDGDTVLVNKGIYTGEGNRNLVLNRKSITVQSADPYNSETVAATVIDCENNGYGIKFDSRIHDSILVGLTITNGSAAGIIIVDGARPIIKQCVIRNNARSNYGGGIYIDGGHAIISECIIIENSARFGGGICYRKYRYSPSSTLKVNNCIIANNSASWSGGGVYFQGSGGNGQTHDAVFENCTITGNFAAKFCGGLSFSEDYLPLESCTVHNSIIWGNTAPTSAQTMGDNSISYSNVQGGYTGEGNFDVDPLFVDPANDDFHLQNESLCINGGNPSCVADPNELDIDGELRVINGRIDVGADEFNYEGPVLGISQMAVEFIGYTLSGNPDSQTLTVRNTGSGTISWEITGGGFMARDQS
jgi:hypothetical protein